MNKKIITVLNLFLVCSGGVGTSTVANATQISPKPATYTMWAWTSGIVGGTNYVNGRRLSTSLSSYSVCSISIASPECDAGQYIRVNQVVSQVEPIYYAESVTEVHLADTFGSTSRLQGVAWSQANFALQSLRAKGQAPAQFIDDYNHIVYSLDWAISDAHLYDSAVYAIDPSLDGKDVYVRVRGMLHGYGYMVSPQWGSLFANVYSGYDSISQEARDSGEYEYHYANVWNDFDELLLIRPAWSTKRESLIEWTIGTTIRGCPGCSLDASNTAAIRIEVPDGVTFSASGSGFEPLSTFDGEPNTAIPEPSTLALLSISALCFVARRCANRRAPKRR